MRKQGQGTWLGGLRNSRGRHTLGRVHARADGRGETQLMDAVHACCICCASGSRVWAAGALWDSDITWAPCGANCTCDISIAAWVSRCLAQDSGGIAPGRRQAAPGVSNPAELLGLLRQAGLRGNPVDGATNVPAHGRKTTGRGSCLKPKPPAQRALARLAAQHPQPVTQAHARQPARSEAGAAPHPSASMRGTALTPRQWWLGLCTRVGTKLSREPGSGCSPRITHPLPPARAGGGWAEAGLSLNGGRGAAREAQRGATSQACKPAGQAVPGASSS